MIAAFKDGFFVSAVFDGKDNEAAMAASFPDAELREVSFEESQKLMGELADQRAKAFAKLAAEIEAAEIEAENDDKKRGK